MNYEEALAWLRGERSTINYIDMTQPDWQAQLAVADANMTKQAYYIVRAHEEGLVK